MPFQMPQYLRAPLNKIWAAGDFDETVISNGYILHTEKTFSSERACAFVYSLCIAHGQLEDSLCILFGQFVGRNEMDRKIDNQRLNAASITMLDG